MITPVLHRVLIKPKTLEEANPTYKKMSELGLAIPQHTDTRREEKAVEIGTIVAMGDTCFKDFGTTVIPHIGDLVYYAKYSGKEVKDVDGTEYLLTNDDDICAILTNSV